MVRECLIPKTLPRYIGIEHEIELLTGAKPLDKVAYQMASLLGYGACFLFIAWSTVISGKAIFGKAISGKAIYGK